jgi:hypothetical protein
MSLSVNRNKSIGCDNPVLIFANYKDGFLYNPFSLEYIIYDISTTDKKVNPVQVFPVAGRQAVDLNDCDDGGDRLSLGRFAAEWAVGGGQALGDHMIEWFVITEDGVDETTYSQKFQVLPEDEVIPAGYITISDMRREGVTVDLADDDRVLLAIKLATDFIDRITGRNFSSSYKTIKFDGRGGPKLLLMEPIIALESMRIEELPYFTSGDTLITPDTLKVYNRHIERNLVSPDDRSNPKIELRATAILEGRRTVDINLFQVVNFPRGQQNIEVTGIFGFTDPDGSTLGSTPEEIKLVARKLALRELPELLDFDAREDFQNRFKITREKTRDQLIQYIERPAGRANTAFFGYFTGDPLIDNILAAYMRPPALGSA